MYDLVKFEAFFSLISSESFGKRNLPGGLGVFGFALSLTLICDLTRKWSDGKKINGSALLLSTVGRHLLGQIMWSSVWEPSVLCKGAVLLPGKLLVARV